MKQKRLVKQAKITNIAVAALFCVASIIYMIWHGEEDIALLRWVFSITFVVVGSAKLFGYFSNDAYRLAYQFDFAIGILTAILGVVMFFWYDAMLSYLPIVFGVYSMLQGLIIAQIAFDAKKFGFSFWFILFSTSMLLALLGVGVLVWHYYSKGNVHPIFVGGTLLFTALESGYLTIYTVRVRARKENVEKNFEAELEAEKNHKWKFKY